MSELVQHNAARGVFAMVLAVLLFSIADAIAKWSAGNGFYPGQIVFMRYVFGLIPMGIAILISGFASLKTRRPAAHLLRALLMCVSLLLFFWGLGHLPLAEAMAVAFTGPLFITALSVPILGEKVGLHRWGAVIVGFFGMLIILRPGTDSFRMESLIVLASAFSFAIGVLYTRKISRTETNVAMFAFTTLIAGVATLPIALTTWQSPMPTDWGLFFVLGLAGGAAHFLVIVAYRNAPASVNAPIEYTALIWASLLGWVVWRETTEIQVWLGALLIALAGVYITHRETTLKPARSGRAT